MKSSNPPEGHIRGGARPEAAPPDKPTSDQERAKADVLALLQSIAAEQGDGAGGGRFHAAQRNHALLIDGARGSGKTSALYAIWNELEQARSAPRDHGDREPMIVPLEIIDLHTLPRASSLLLHLARSFAALFEAEGDERVDAVWGPEGAHDALRDGWRRFRRVAAAGWESNLPERRASLDIEAYAFELDESEIARHDLDDAFRDFIDRLCEHAQGRRVREAHGAAPRPLFVAFIDDADMNPRRSVELLRLLRLIAHPRVAFVMTGHSRMFLTTLAASFLTTLRYPGNHTMIRAVDEDLQALVPRGDVLRLAREFYDRVIPAAQRFRLPAFSPDERWKRFEEIMRDRGEDFADITVSASSELTLGQIFSVGFALNALPDRLRGLHDLAMKITSWERETVPLHLCVYLWRESVAQADLAAAERDALQHVVRRDGAKLFISWDSVSLRPITSDLCELRTVRVDLTSLDRARGPASLSCVLRAKSIHGYAGALRASGGGSIELSPLVVASLMVANDVSVLGGFGVHLGAASLFSGLDSVAIEVSSRWRDEDLAFMWPLPRWTTNRDVDAMSSAFTELAQRILRDSNDRSEQKIADRLALAFFQAVYFVAKRSPKLLSEEPSWAAVGGWLGELATMDDEYQEWAQGRCWLLGAPESGLPVRTREQIIGHSVSMLGQSANSGTVSDPMRRVDEARWEHVADAFRRAHPTLAADEIGARVHAFLRELQGVEPALPWVPRPVSTEDRLRSFRYANEDLSIYLGDNVTERTLADYALGSPTRFDLLTMARPVFDGLLDQLEPHHELGSLSTLRLREIWLWACEKLARAEVGRLVTRAGDRSIRIDEVAARETGPMMYCTTAGSNRRVCVRRVFFAVRFLHDGPVLPPALDLLYRMLRDLGADSLIRAQSPASSQRRAEAWFAGGIAPSRGDATETVIPWPLIEWPSLLDWDLIDDAWDEALHAHFSFESERAGEAVADVVDALAFALISNGYEVLERRRTPSFRAGWVPAASDWTELLAKRVGRTHTQERLVGPRWAAYDQWRRRLPLFATPELGLSADAAGGILHGLRAAKGMPDLRLDPEGLRALRAEHLKAANITDPETLRGGDEGHPWFEFAGRDDPPKA